mmetsp:Transcript_94997/g.268410  ORF Transcript_94997/g.268410 Transcript_94997/m.268410 type:complete len:230 (+) Transcript_94997:601-1290(+)
MSMAIPSAKRKFGWKQSWVSNSERPMFVSSIGNRKATAMVQLPGVHVFACQRCTSRTSIWLYSKMLLCHKPKSVQWMPSDSVTFLKIRQLAVAMVTFGSSLSGSARMLTNNFGKPACNLSRTASNCASTTLTSVGGCLVALLVGPKTMSSNPDRIVNNFHSSFHLPGTNASKRCESQSTCPVNQPTRAPATAALRPQMSKSWGGQAVAYWPGAWLGWRLPLAPPMRPGL